MLNGLSFTATRRVRRSSAALVRTRSCRSLAVDLSDAQSNLIARLAKRIGTTPEKLLLALALGLLEAETAESGEALTYYAALVRDFTEDQRIPTTTAQLLQPRTPCETVFNRFGRAA